VSIKASARPIVSSSTVQVPGGLESDKSAA